jgi:hypothetical protein
VAEAEQSPYEWFQEAGRWYIDRHQGCPWCGGANCVYKSQRGAVVEYSCGSCDFMACHNEEAAGYFMAPGRRRVGRVTMRAV